MYQKLMCSFCAVALLGDQNRMWKCDGVFTGTNHSHFIPVGCHMTIKIQVMLMGTLLNDTNTFHLLLQNGENMC
jgi:hypothetical protein